jgi:cytochrome c553
MNISKLFLGIVALLVAPMLTSAQQGESHIGKVSGHPDAGRQLYFRYCWGCHGFHGDGNGENAPYLNILPRNFVAATFKCRSTPTGTLPTDQDLFNSLVRGFNNSNMPSWIVLTDQNRADLVAFIKTFSPRWKTEKAGDAIAVSLSSRWKALSMDKSYFRSWNAGSVTDRKGAAMVLRRQR